LPFRPQRELTHGSWGFPRSCPNQVEIQQLHLLARPKVAAQEFETGGEAGVVGEAADIDLSPEFFPTIVTHQLVEDRLQRDAMKRILGLFLGHEVAMKFLRRVE